jgi:hypothetical protein
MTNAKTARQISNVREYSDILAECDEVLNSCESSAQDLALAAEISEGLRSGEWSRGPTRKQRDRLTDAYLSVMSLASSYA